jgi:putative DNA primase/helicase
LPISLPRSKIARSTVNAPTTSSPRRCLATSITLSAILTTLDRRSMATAPLHAFTSPTAGTGKCLLVDICAMLATGRPMPVISQGGSVEEFEKRLSAALLAGDMAISLDNCDHEVGGPFLCQVLTQRHVNIRILGLSRNVETPVSATIFATGNNLVIAGNATRRALLSAMDAGLERPERRKFSSNAWHTSGEHVNLSPFGSFEEWSYRVREPLVWLGQIDPCETLFDVRNSDPQRDDLIAVLMQWQLHLGENRKHTVQQVIERAVNASTFHAALMGVAGSRNGRFVSNILLGRWLKRVEGKIANGLVLRQDGNDCGYPLWKLERR